MTPCMLATAQDGLIDRKPTAVKPDIEYVKMMALSSKAS